MSGYASREVCECDQTQQDCPPLDGGKKVPMLPGDKSVNGRPQKGKNDSDWTFLSQHVQSLDTDN